MTQNLFSSIGIADRCKKIFGMPPSTARKHFGPVLQAISQGAELHDAMVEAITEVDIPAISAWLRGEEPANFAGLFQSNAATTKIIKKQKGFEKALESSLMDSLHYFEHLKSSISYSVFMVESVARMQAQSSGRPMSEELGNCYLYLQTGVGHPIAVFLLKETVMRDRRRAMDIAEHFDPEFPYRSKDCGLFMAAKEPLLRELLSEYEFASVRQAAAVAGVQLSTRLHD